MASWRSWLPLVVVALLVVGAIAVQYAGVGQATAVQAAGCPASASWPTVTTGVPLFTDNTVSVYAGKDYSATTGDAESEGLLVVMGDATFGGTGGGTFTVGSVPIGSQVAPSPGTDMLAVGGDLTVAPNARLSVGLGVQTGGHVVVGGSVAAHSTVDTGGGGLRHGSGDTAVESFRGFGSLVTQQSAELATSAPTASVSLTGDTLYVTGDDSSAVQVVNVDSPTLAKATALDLLDIPDGASLSINVIGDGARLALDEIKEKGVDVGAVVSSSLATHLLWNFVDSSTVRVGGSRALLGSILVARGDLELATGTNGRVYATGSITKSGSAGQQHSYAWLGTAAFACQADRASADQGGTPTAVATAAATQRNIASGALILVAIVVLIVWAVLWRRRGRAES
jgi:choice-of-anchor A domain-containing protein